MTEIDTRRPAPALLSQSTAIEQARAVAEVQAAVTVAQQMPRVLGDVEAEMMDACARTGLAEKAFYTVKNRGDGPSVHLARELARIWGNTDYGVHELRRDDQNHVSEIRAYCWDQEKNTRQTRTFIVPHMIDTKQGPRKINDLIDVYRNNQNVGARALRECIMSALPSWFVDTAIERCAKTLRDGGGIPLDQRIENMIGRFRDLDESVSVARLEKRIGKRRAAWGPAEIRDMTIVYTSIARGETTVAVEFPNKVTADEINDSMAVSPAPVDRNPTPAELDPSAPADWPAVAPVKP